jgi:predicted amidohydrolase YtcJ
VIPKPTHQLRREALELALADLAEHGVTSAQDYSPNWENFEILRRAGKRRQADGAHLGMAAL